jgi:hypothetical protein
MTYSKIVPLAMVFCSLRMGEAEERACSVREMIASAIATPGANLLAHSITVYSPLAPSA